MSAVVSIPELDPAIRWGEVYDDTPDCPGPWWSFAWKDGMRTAKVPVVRCPRGHICALSKHTIDADGTVHASIACNPGLGRSCDWHVMGKLEGWRP